MTSSDEKAFAGVLKSNRTSVERIETETQYSQLQEVNVNKKRDVITAVMEKIPPEQCFHLLFFTYLVHQMSQKHFVFLFRQ